MSIVMSICKFLSFGCCRRPSIAFEPVGLAGLGSHRSVSSGLRGGRGLGGGGGGLGGLDVGLPLRGEIGLRLGLGGLLRGARGGLHVGGDAGLRGRALRGARRLRADARLALRAGGLLGRVALRALGLALAVLLGGLRAVLVVRALDDLREAVQDQLDAADGVVVARDDVVDRLRVGVRVDDRDDGDVQADRLLDGVRLLDAVDDEDAAGLLGHLGDARQVRLELRELAAEHRVLLLVLGELAAVRLRRRLQLAHALDGGAEGLRVGERAAEPALGHVELVDALRRLLDHLGDLLLRRDEEDLLAGEDGVAHERGRLVEELDGLLEVDDVDAVALVEDVAFHLRIPALGLVTEVQTGVKEVLEGDAREGRRRHFHFLFLSQS